MAQSTTRFHAQLKRINPYPGLMIDAEIWRDAHNYHREQMRLHLLAMHGMGIAQGLNVSVVGQDNQLRIEPGLAVDAAGHFLLVGESTVYGIQSRGPGTIYLILTYREVLSGETSTGIAGLGQNTHIVEAYQIKQAEYLPNEPYIELARIEYDPTQGPIRAALDPRTPGLNELDLRYRQRLGTAGAAPTSLLLAPPEDTPDSPVHLAPDRETDGPAQQSFVAPTVPGIMDIALAVHSGSGWEAHREGLRYLVREVEAAYGFPVRILEGMELREAYRADLVYLSGYSHTVINDDEVASLRRLVDRGGVLLGEACPHGPEGESGARAFVKSFIDLTDRLGRSMTDIERGHRLLGARNLFAFPPTGSSGTARVLEADGVVYSDADYGCAWMGGTEDKPLPRSAIRDALELGVNIALYRRAPR